MGLLLSFHSIAMTRTAGKFRIVIANVVWRSTSKEIASVVSLHRNDKNRWQVQDCHRERSVAIYWQWDCFYHYVPSQ
jgi:hypothetical protein